MHPAWRPERGLANLLHRPRYLHRLRACVPECPYHAIFPLDEVPAAFRAQGGEVLNAPGLSGRYDGVNHRGEAVSLSTTRVLGAGEVVDLRPSIQDNAAFYGS